MLPSLPQTAFTEKKCIRLATQVIEPIVPYTVPLCSRADSCSPGRRRSSSYRGHRWCRRRQSCTTFARTWSGGSTEWYLRERNYSVVKLPYWKPSSPVLHCVTSANVPSGHTWHRSPACPSLHLHTPVCGWHVEESEPNGWQSHSEEKVQYVSE